MTIIPIKISEFNRIQHWETSLRYKIQFYAQFVKIFRDPFIVDPKLIK